MSVFYLFQFTIFRWNYQLTFHKKGEILEHVLLTSKGNYTKMKLVSAVQSLFCFTKLLNEYVITAENPSGFFFRMENLVRAVFSNGRWENPKEFDTWKIPGKLEFLKMRLVDKDHSDIPSDPKVYTY